MGIFFRLHKHSNNHNQINIEENKNKISKNKDKENEYFELNRGNIANIITINKDLPCLKIYIVGKGENKNYLINNLFKKEIKDSYLKTIADKEFITEQFHWIARIYKDEILTEDIIKQMRNEIKNDKGSDKKKIMKYQAIICFGNENVKILTENFEELRKSRMIFITEEKCNIDEEMDKRYATNILCKDMSNEDLNIQIISTLWELDCCFTEKGNQICRYTPEKIFKGLEKDNSLFSLNILLTGLSRTGKSTFINLLAGKIIALEADETESVTKNISEYYIYRDDDNDEHGAIKLIDTPGIVPNQNNNNLEHREVEKKVINMIKDEDKTFENKIHFIFFVLMKGAITLEGENIKELLNSLNQSKYPVYFIINKVKKKEKKCKVIDPIVEYLSRIGCKNLIDEDNFIFANFKNDDAGEVYGIDNIFKKIYEHIEKKNYLELNLKSKMSELLKDFLSNVVVNKSFLSYQKEDKLIINELKTKIKFHERIEEILELTNKNNLFSNIIVGSLIKNGRNIADKIIKFIVSLSNLKGIFPRISHNISALSIFQAFMIKEIAEGYGLDINILNYGTKLLLNKINSMANSLKDIKKIENIYNETIIEILDNKEIIKSFELIENKIKNTLEKRNNRDSILTLANILNLLKENDNSNGEKLENIQSLDSNYKFTKEVSYFCINFFENELIESEGLNFMLNYFNKYESLLKDIEYYINKKDWEKFNIEIKK